MNRIFLAAAIFIITFTSCHIVTGKRIQGNGIVKSEARPVGSFNNVDVSGGIDVYVKQDSVSSVRVEADENLLEYVHINAEDGTLEIKEERGFNLQSTKGIKVYVSGPSFKHFDASGACGIYSENKISGSNDISMRVSGASSITMELHAPNVKAELTGASHIRLSGETKTFSADGSGASGLKCFELMTEETDVEISGASHAEVFASVKLDLHASGASTVKYKGNASITQEANGASSVSKAE
ncbi:MAG TPA: head GIN domain-containing protein [Chitinophagaceae bacterium]|nr:head GIN domain-containing protein [Chitinophagaceae bacterium]